jgi:dihydrofolate synthase/folylpolyglutamate synthase
MSSSHRSISYLYGLQYRGIKYGLRNIHLLLRAAGNPHLAFPAVHVAGTNGKGSTSSFIAASFSASGYRTGLYTSPHLVRFTERIRIDGIEMPEKRLIEYVEWLRPAIEDCRATFFEATTCIAFRYFADEKVAVAVIETGLGGRLDATNVLTPMVSVITNVALDHQEYLGSTLRSIAREKGGILKPGVPAVTAAGEQVVLRVLRKIAGEKGTRLHECAERVVVRSSRSGRGTISLQGQTLRTGPVRPGLPGDYQQTNAALAVAALDILRSSMRFRRAFRRLTGKSVREGIRNVRALTGIRGRRETLSAGGVRFILDVAHNPAGLNALLESLRSERVHCPVGVFGVLRDKEYAPMLRAFAAAVGHLLLVTADSPRALPATALVRLARREGLSAEAAGSLHGALRKAAAIVRSGKRVKKGGVLVAGSHYLVGAALRRLEKTA